MGIVHIMAIWLLCSSSPGLDIMASQTKSASVVVSESLLPGWVDWTLTSDALYALDSDTASATLPVSGSASRTEAVVASGFGFDIPTAATIEGMLIRVAGTSDVEDTSYILTPQIYCLSSGRWEYVTFDDAYLPLVEAYVETGGVSTLWTVFGSQWTANDVNSSRFQLGFWVGHDGSASECNVTLNHIEITVYFSLEYICSDVADLRNVRDDVDTGGRRRHHGGISGRRGVANATCDRCGFSVRASSLKWQRGYNVCERCFDE